MSNQNETSVAPQQRPAAAQPQNKPKRQPPYQIVVLNDEDHTFAYVIEGLVRFCGHDVEKAYELATTVHQQGRAIVWTGMLEVAELKRDQLKAMGPDFYAPKVVTYPLGVLLEPMPQ
ncbi:MAG TPA: ATP-dependent Clp protease adaptor ClpS [Tepidisphaeraceae bacterium]|jgi:ATP-dependent Clp protease adaptor protein ClpS